MQNNYIENPETKRLIKISGKTHRQLINKGIMLNSNIDGKILYKISPDDNITEIKKQLQKTANLEENEIMSIGRGRYKNCLVKGYKGAKGRPKRKTEKVTEKNPIENIVERMLHGCSLSSEEDVRSLEEVEEDSPYESDESC